MVSQKSKGWFSSALSDIPIFTKPASKKAEIFTSSLPVNFYENSFPIYKGSDSITINIYGVEFFFFSVMLLKVMWMCKGHQSL